MGEEELWGWVWGESKVGEEWKRGVTEGYKAGTDYLKEYWVAHRGKVWERGE